MSLESWGIKIMFGGILVMNLRRDGHYSTRHIMHND